MKVKIFRIPMGVIELGTGWRDGDADKGEPERVLVTTKHRVPEVLFPLIQMYPAKTLETFKVQAAIVSKLTEANVDNAIEIVLDGSEFTHFKTALTENIRILAATPQIAVRIAAIMENKGEEMEAEKKGADHAAV